MGCPSKGLVVISFPNMKRVNPNASEDEIYKALEIAQIKDYVISTGKNYWKVSIKDKCFRWSKNKDYQLQELWLKNHRIYIF